MAANRNRKFNFGTVMNFLYLFATVMTITAIIRLVIWSYNETLKLSGGVTGTEFSGNLAIVVQLGPIVFLLARRVFKEHRVMLPAATALFWLAIVFNLADWLTNELAYAIGGYVLPEELLVGFDVTEIPANAQWAVAGGTAFGHFVCAAVTWGEELIMWLIALAGHFIYLVLVDFGGDPPHWMAITKHNAKRPSSQPQPAGGNQPHQQPKREPVTVSANGGSQPNRRTRQRPPVPAGQRRN